MIIGQEGKEREVDMLRDERELVWTNASVLWDHEMITTEELKCLAIRIFSTQEVTEILEEIEVVENRGDQHV